VLSCQARKKSFLYGPSRQWVARQIY